MKKLFLGLIATVMIGFAGNAQTNVYSKSSMVVLVTQAKKTYTKGASYQEWLSRQIGTEAKPTEQEAKLLQEIYGFLSTSANAETIFNNYKSNSLVELAQLHEKDGLSALGSNNARCGWLCQLLIEILVVIIQFLPGLP